MKKQSYLSQYYNFPVNQKYWSLFINEKNRLYNNEPALIAKQKEWKQDGEDVKNALSGLVFETQKQADRHYEYLKAYQEFVTTIARIHAEHGFKIDSFHNHNQNTNIFVVDFVTKKLYSYPRTHCHAQPDREYFMPYIEERLIKELGVDLIVLAVTGYKYKGVTYLKQTEDYKQ